MREIIFRGKREDNGEWVYGWLFDFDYIKPFEKDNCAIRVDRETIGQYIGLNDKDGKRIFEGDIVKGIFNFNEISGVIRYAGDASFYIDRGDIQGIYVNNADAWLGVTGNIYD